MAAQALSLVRSLLQCQVASHLGFLRDDRAETRAVNLPRSLQADRVISRLVSRQANHQICLASNQALCRQVGRQIILLVYQAENLVKIQVLRLPVSQLVSHLVSLAVIHLVSLV